jgi:uncharacterized protein (TIGR03437 family)
MASQADQAAIAAGIDISKYSHLLYMMPDEMKTICSYGGSSTIGGSPSREWVNSGIYPASGPYMDFIYVILAHELGHGLSLAHSQSIQADGTLVEYGDNSSPMGDDGYNVVDFSVVNRIQEGWIPLSNILQVTQSGTYTVNYAEAPTQTAQAQALQIAAADATGDMYVTYRQPGGLDANLPPAFLGGATIQYWRGGVNKSQLATNSPWGGALTDNQTYSSPSGAVTITQVSHDATTVTLNVRITAPDASSSVNAATLLGGSLAMDTISTALGTRLATGTAVATTNALPMSLGGTSVTVVDSLGAWRPAPLYFVSPTEVNFVMPEGLYTGQAEVSVRSGDGTASVGNIQIATVAPGIFTLDSAGLATGSVLRVKSDGTQTTEAVFERTANGALAPRPIDLSDATDKVYLSLYGTGLRSAGATGTFVTIGGFNAPVTSAGADGTMAGLDQVTVLLPHSLAGQGVAVVALAAGGVQANAANVSIGGTPVPLTPTAPLVLASDDFTVPPYQLADLAGQQVGGSGFAGVWTNSLEGGDLTVTGPGTVGSPVVDAGLAGDCAKFASPLSLPPGQLFISYNIANQRGSDLISSGLGLSQEVFPVCGSTAMLGGNARFFFTINDALGITTKVQTQIATTGSHRIVGVLDATNHQIAIFVDPTAQSFYSSTGANNADAVAAWVPAAGLAFQSYSLIEGFHDQVGFSHVAFSRNSTPLTQVQ